MDDEIAFDILNDYEPGVPENPRREVLWDLAIDYDDGPFVQNLGEDGRVPGWFVVSGSQARFRTGDASISLEFVDSVEHMRRGVIVRGQTSVVEENKDAPYGVMESGLWWVTWYLVPRRPREI